MLIHFGTDEIWLCTWKSGWTRFATKQDRGAGAASGAILQPSSGPQGTLELPEGEGASLHDQSNDADGQPRVASAAESDVTRSGLDVDRGPGAPAGPATAVRREDRRPFS